MTTYQKTLQASVNDFIKTNPFYDESAAEAFQEGFRDGFRAHKNLAAEELAKLVNSLSEILQPEELAVAVALVNTAARKIGVLGGEATL